MSFCVPDRLHLLRGAVTAVYKETCTYRASTNNLVLTLLNGTFDWSLSSTLEGFGRTLCVRLVKIKCLKCSEHSSPPHRECCRDPIGLQSCDFPIALGVAEWLARACFFSIVERPPHRHKSSQRSTVGTRRMYQKRAGPVWSHATACHLFVGIILCLHNALVPINAALHFLCLADSQCVMMHFPKWKVHNCQVWAVYVGTPLRPWCLSKVRNTMKSVDHRQLIAGESKWYDFQRTRRAWDWERAGVRFWCFQCISPSSVQSDTKYLHLRRAYGRTRERPHQRWTVQWVSHAVTLWLSVTFCSVCIWHSYLTYVEQMAKGDQCCCVWLCISVLFLPLTWRIRKVYELLLDGHPVECWCDGKNRSECLCYTWVFRSYFLMICKVGGLIVYEHVF